MKTLFLYTTSACHLCEQAEALISPMLESLKLELGLVEISDSDELMNRYGIKIPVLGLKQSTNELAWPFSKTEFVEFIEKS